MIIIWNEPAVGFGNFIVFLRLTTFFDNLLLDKQQLAFGACLSFSGGCARDGVLSNRAV